ncbi:MAG: hypothetical protein KDE47_32640, partial [Caldilineaceae bacterium]|nr:hypothetical protein [Caldilineaceae bacterium]
AGSAYYLYTTGVAAANAAAAAPAFAAVAESFTLKGSVPPIAPTGLNLDFTEWEEPIESAFTVDVPAEWVIDGGVLHASDIDQRRWLTANSPDESIIVTIGDSRVPSFVEPNAALTAQGYAEGDSLFVGDTELTVWPYRPGEEFLLDYAEYFLDLTNCDLTPVALPQLTQLIRAYVTRNGLAVELGDQQDAGVLTYRCGSGDEQYEGFLLAATASFPLEDATLWQPIALYGYEAAPGDAAMAAAVLKEMMGSYVVDTQWLRAQFGYGAEEADDLVAHANALALLMTDALPQDAAMGDTTAIDATKMEEFATIDDPDLANAITVYLDPTFGWLDSDNHLLGTATPAQPEELDFRALFSSDAE